MAPVITEGNKNDTNSNDGLVATTDKLKISDTTDDMVVDLDSDENVDEGAQQSTTEVSVKRSAKKSTTTVDLRQPPAAATRRQVALANSYRKGYSSHDKFMENFDPESSVRERRKLTRKVNSVVGITRKIPGALYDENGIHIATGIDLCDCLQRACPGCHFPCPKCKSPKCGPECRCNRKYTYEQIEYHGCDLVIKNLLNK